MTGPGSSVPVPACGAGASTGAVQAWAGAEAGAGAGGGRCAGRRPARAHALGWRPRPGRPNRRALPELAAISPPGGGDDSIWPSRSPPWRRPHRQAERPCSSRRRSARVTSECPRTARRACTSCMRASAGLPGEPDVPAGRSTAHRARQPPSSACRLQTIDCSRCRAAREWRSASRWHHIGHVLLLPARRGRHGCRLGRSRRACRRRWRSGPACGAGPSAGQVARAPGRHAVDQQGWRPGRDGWCVPGDRAAPHQDRRSRRAAPIAQAATRRRPRATGRPQDELCRGPPNDGAALADSGGEGGRRACFESGSPHRRAPVAWWSSSVTVWTPRPRSLILGPPRAGGAPRHMRRICAADRPGLLDRRRSAPWLSRRRVACGEIGLAER